MHSVETAEMPKRLSLVVRRFATGCLQRDTAWMPMIFILDECMLDPAAIDAVHLPGPLLLERSLPTMAPPTAQAPTTESLPQQTE
jgi:hypothetical protein